MCRFVMALFMALLLTVYALFAPEALMWQRVALLVSAAVVVSAWIAADARVECAQTPIILHDKPDPEKTKPPEYSRK